MVTCFCDSNDIHPTLALFGGNFLFMDRVLPSDLFGGFKWPFQGLIWLSALHLGDQKVTWKKLGEKKNMFSESNVLCSYHSIIGKWWLPMKWWFYGCIRLPTRKCDTFQADNFVPCPKPQIAKISFAIYQMEFTPNKLNLSETSTCFQLQTETGKVSSWGSICLFGIDFSLEGNIVGVSVYQY